MEKGRDPETTLSTEEIHVLIKPPLPGPRPPPDRPHGIKKHLKRLLALA